MDLAELVVGIIPILIIGYLIRLIKYKFNALCYLQNYNYCNFINTQKNP